MLRKHEVVSPRVGCKLRVRCQELFDSWHRGFRGIAVLRNDVATGCHKPAQCIQLGLDILCAMVAIQNNQNPPGTRGQFCNPVDEAGACRKAPEELNAFPLGFRGRHLSRSLPLIPMRSPLIWMLNVSSDHFAGGVDHGHHGHHPNRAATRVRASLHN